MTTEHKKFSLEEMCHLNEEYKDGLIAEYYCHKFPKKSKADIYKKVYTDVVTELLKRVDTSSEDDQLENQIKNIVSGLSPRIISGSFSDAFPIDNILNEASTRFLAFIAEIKDSRLLFQFWVKDEKKKSGLIDLYSFLKREKLIDSNYTFDEFKTCFTFKDPIKETVEDLIKKYQKVKPIIWVGEQFALHHLLKEFKNLGVCSYPDGIKHIEYAQGLIKDKSNKDFNWTKLSDNARNVNGKAATELKRRISSAVSMLK